MNNKKTALLLILIVITGISVHAQQTGRAQQYDNENDFKIEFEGSGIMITKYLGKKTEVHIPPSMQNLPVIGIGDHAFVNCRNITSVTIPENVTSIGDYAFLQCYSLISVTIPNSVTSIGEYAFINCNSLISVTIPKNVTSIGTSAFQVCANLTEIKVAAGNSAYSAEDGVLYNKNKTNLIAYPAGKTSVLFTIPDSVTAIEVRAFIYARLTSITIPNRVATIGDSAFWNCASLKSVTIGNSVTSIGDFAFLACAGLISVTIPNNVNNIGKFAFSDCDSLFSITIGNGVTSIGDGALSSCAGLTEINVAADNNTYTSENGILYNKNKTVLLQYPAGKTAVSFIIPNNVTGIEDSAFSGCKNLVSVTIPNSVTSIDESAFFNCTSLTSVTFESTIPSSRFSNSSYRPPFPGNLRDKFYATNKTNGTPGTYTTTAPVGYSSKWTKK